MLKTTPQSLPRLYPDSTHVLGVIAIEDKRTEPTMMRCFTILSRRQTSSIMLYYEGARTHCHTVHTNDLDVEAMWSNKL